MAATQPDYFVPIATLAAAVVGSIVTLSIAAVTIRSGARKEDREVRRTAALDASADLRGIISALTDLAVPDNTVAWAHEVIPVLVRATRDLHVVWMKTYVVGDDRLGKAIGDLQSALGLLVRSYRSPEWSHIQPLWSEDDYRALMRTHKMKLLDAARLSILDPVKLSKYVNRSENIMLGGAALSFPVFFIAIGIAIQHPISYTGPNGGGLIFFLIACLMPALLLVLSGWLYRRWGMRLHERKLHPTRDS